MSSKSPLVSVVIPVYNAERYIKAAITSVIDQTLKTAEIIVVDDCSTDNSRKVISGFKGINLIESEKNMGVGYSRNRGVEMSTGEFITFLDADDFWVKEKLKVQINILLKKRSIDGVFGEFENFFEQGAIIPLNIQKEIFLRPESGKIKALGTMMVRRKVFERVGMFSESIKFGEDLDWFIRASDSDIKFQFYPHLFMYRRLHESNLSYSSLDNKKHLIDIFKNSIKRKRDLNR